jgi:hypothetical protein
MENSLNALIATYKLTKSYLDIVENPVIYSLFGKADVNTYIFTI